jgi:hypothetical protein
MDSNILSTIAIVVSVLSIIIGIINHRKVKSKCFGHDIGETSIDITTTTNDLPPLPASLSSDLDDAPSSLRIKPTK